MMLNHSKNRNRSLLMTLLLLLAGAAGAGSAVADGTNDDEPGLELYVNTWAEVGDEVNAWAGVWNLNESESYVLAATLLDGDGNELYTNSYLLSNTTSLQENLSFTATAAGWYVLEVRLMDANGGEYDFDQVEIEIVEAYVPGPMEIGVWAESNLVLADDGLRAGVFFINVSSTTENVWATWSVIEAGLIVDTGNVSDMWGGHLNLTDLDEGDYILEAILFELNADGTQNELDSESMGFRVVQDSATLVVDLDWEDYAADDCLYEWLWLELIPMDIWEQESGEWIAYRTSLSSLDLQDVIVPAGEMMVQANAWCHDELHAWGALGMQTKWDWDNRTSLDIGASDILDVEFELFTSQWRHGEATMEGEVLWEDYNGGECEQIQVHLWDADEWFATVEDERYMLEPINGFSMTGPGTYSMDGLPDGEFVVDAWAGCNDEDDDWWSGHGLYRSDDGQVGTVMLIDDMTSYGIDIQMETHEDGDWFEDFETGEFHYSLDIEILDDETGHSMAVLRIGAEDVLDATFREKVDFDGDGAVSEMESDGFLNMLQSHVDDEDMDDDEGPQFEINGDAMPERLSMALAVDNLVGDVPAVWGEDEVVLSWTLTYAGVDVIYDDANTILFLDDAHEDDDMDMANEWGTISATIDHADWEISSISDSEGLYFEANEDNSHWVADGVDAGEVEVKFQLREDLEETPSTSPELWLFLDQEEVMVGDSLDYAVEISGMDGNEMYLLTTELVMHNGDLMDSNVMTITGLESHWEDFSSETTAVGEYALYVYLLDEDGVEIAYDIRQDIVVLEAEEEPDVDLPPICAVYWNYVNGTQTNSGMEISVGPSGEMNLGLTPGDYLIYVSCEVEDGDEVYVEMTLNGIMISGDASEADVMMEFTVEEAWMGESVTIDIHWESETQVEDLSITLTVVEAEEGGVVPGFGAFATLVALIGALALAERRRQA